MLKRFRINNFIGPSGSNSTFARTLNQLASIQRLWHTRYVSAQELRQLLRASVFRPFTVFADGQEFLIAHPEFAALDPRGRTLIVFHKEDSAFEILDVPLIARAQVHEPPSPRQT